MTPAQLKEWLPLLEIAPDGIKEYLLGTFWILTFLVLIWGILKLLFSKDFKKLYVILVNVAKTTGELSKGVAKVAAKNLELPEPYPKLTKFFTILFMVNNYAVFFLFTSFFLVFSILFVTSDRADFLQRVAGMLFSIFLAYFARFFFVQAERDRIKFI